MHREGCVQSRLESLHGFLYNIPKYRNFGGNVDFGDKIQVCKLFASADIASCVQAARAIGGRAHHELEQTRDVIDDSQLTGVDEYEEWSNYNVREHLLEEKHLKGDIFEFFHPIRKNAVRFLGAA